MGLIGKLFGMLLWVVAGWLTSIFVGELAVVFMVMFPVAYLILSTNRELKEELQELRNQVKNLKTKLEYLEEEKQAPQDPSECKYRKLVLVSFSGRPRVDLVKALSDIGLTFEQACNCLNMVPFTIYDGWTEEECAEIAVFLESYGMHTRVAPDYLNKKHNSAWQDLKNGNENAVVSSAD